MRIEAGFIFIKYVAEIELIIVIFVFGGPFFGEFSLYLKFVRKAQPNNFFLQRKSGCEIFNRVANYKSFFYSCSTSLVIENCEKVNILETF